MFYCEFCEIFKNTFFTEHLWTSASGALLIWLLWAAEVYLERSPTYKKELFKEIVNGYSR